MQNKSSRDSTVGIGTGWTVEDLGFNLRQERQIFSYSTPSRPALRFTQPPVRLLSEDLSVKVKHPELEADHSPSSRDEARV